MAAVDTGLLDLISTALQVVAIGNMLSGIPASIRMWQTRNTDGWPFLFFVIGTIGGVGMVNYGILTDNFTLILLNGLLLMLNGYYILTYVILVEHKGQPVRIIVGAGGYLVAMYSYIRYQQLTADQTANLLGSSSGTVFLVMNCVTILDVIEAYISKKANFDMIMFWFGLLNCCLWTTYGLLLNDPYLYAPNVPFLLTSVIKLIQMVLYRPTAQEKKKVN